MGHHDLVKQLVRDLENAKKKLRLEYNKGIRVLDEAIVRLQKLELDAGAMLKKIENSKTEASAELIRVSRLVGGRTGKRGRSSKNAEKPGLTQLIMETVKQKRKFLHQREIVQLLAKKFPDEEMADFSKKVSVLLAALKRQGRVVTLKSGNANKSMLWGLPEFSRKSRT